MMPFATGPIRAELLSIERLELKAEAIEYFFGYSRAVAALVSASQMEAFRAAAVVEADGVGRAVRAKERARVLRLHEGREEPHANEPGLVM